MSDEHKHLWGPSGCWCGAKQCTAEGFIDREGKFRVGGVRSALKFRSTKFARCKEAAIDGTRCAERPTPDHEGWKDATFGG